MCKNIVYLGGTCNGSTWRNELTPMLTVPYFNPVVDDWNDEAQRREYEARETSKFNVLVLTPKMIGVFAIAELVDIANNRPESLVLCILKEYDGETFTDVVWKSLKATEKLVSKYPVKICSTLAEVADYVNTAN